MTLRGLKSSMSESDVRGEVRINALKRALVHTSGEMYAPCRCLMRKISVLLTEEEFAVFEQYCNERGHKKSTLIAKLIRDRLAEERMVIQRQLFVSTEKSNRRSA
jgi:hypothetical protein